MYLTISLIILLSAIAYQDYKKMEVHDLFIIMLWFLAIFYGELYVLTLSFTFLWLINTIATNKMGWADILGIPPFVSMIYFYPQNTILISLILTLFVIIFVYKKIEKKYVPLFPYMLVFYLLLLFFSYLTSYIGGI